MGHWYAQDGSPQHFQTIKTGKNKGSLRGTTLTDARKLDLVPSVTGVIDIMNDGGGLTAWKIKQALLKQKAELNGEEYAVRDYAAEGSEIHGIVESFINNSEILECEYDWNIEAYRMCYSGLAKELDLKNPVSEATFSTKEYGGSVDIHDKGSKVIIDLKTKDTNGLEDKDMKKYATSKYIMQLVAYRDGLGLPADTKLVTWILSRNKPHEHNWYVWSEEDVKKGEELFKTALTLWQLSNDYKGV